MSSGEIGREGITDVPLVCALAMWKGRVMLAAAAMAVALVTDPSRVSAQEQPIDVVLGVATADTSSDHPTLAIARVDAATPRLPFTRAWSVRGVGHAGWEPVFTMRGTTPEYREGLRAGGGFRVAHTSARIETALVGQAGATRVADAGGWAAFFEGGVNFRWLDPIVDVYAGLRHDDRLARTGALSNYRDPTGRALLGVSVLPLRLGRVAAGVSFESETALPGTGRLPSGVNIAVLCRAGISRP
jgi:hypothetical protein